MVEDKCNICGWVGNADETEIEYVVDGKYYYKYFCPNCGSEDLDDSDENPYEDDDEGLYE